MSNVYLQDKEFLKALMEFPHRTVYLRLVSYGLKGEAAEDEIIGVATGGSINVDGASAVRRTCQLQLTTDQEDILEYNWVFKTRFTVEIGLENTIGGPYSTEDIIWFPQGHYIITSFSSTLGTNSHNISISGQDKMCLLNGEVSGTLTAQTDFGKYEEVDEEGVVSVRVLTLREILENILSVYTNETRGNWEIELPDESGLNLLEYRGDTPVYLLLDTSNSEVTNMTIYGDQKGKINDSQEIIKRVDQLPSYWVPSGLQDSKQNGTEFTTGNTSYYVYPVSYGEVAGYQKTALVFAGDLIEPAGGVITNVLDKIKNMLGEYEYYFDVNGKFYFGPKRNWLKVIWNSNDSTEIVSNQEIEYSYEFNDYGLFTSVANTPDLKNLKNDFTIWGTRKGLNQSDLPIHMRIAIDTKPQEYTSYDGKVYKTSGSNAVDWRELIYQMAWDYNHYAHAKEDFFTQLETNNSGLVNGGRTGYEQYYTDILGFWRQLYQPNPPKKYERIAFNDNSGKTVMKYDWLQAIDTTNKDEYLAKDLEFFEEYPSYLDWFALVNEKYYIPWIETINLLEIPVMQYHWNETDKTEGLTIAEYIDITSLYYYDTQKQGYIPAISRSLPDDAYQLKYEATYSALEYSWNDSNFTGGIKLSDYNYSNDNLYYRIKNNWVKVPTTENSKYSSNPVFYKSGGKYELFINKIIEDLAGSGQNKNYFNENVCKFLKRIYKDKKLWLELQKIERSKLFLKRQRYPTEEGEEKYCLLTEHYEANAIWLLGCYDDALQGIEGNKNKHWKGYLTARSRTLSEVKAIDRPAYEDYYQTSIYGIPVATPILKREIEYYTPTSDYNPDTYWNYSVDYSPETLLFWFDFIESEPLLSTYGVKSIGQRNMAKTEQSVTAIYYPEALPVYFNESFQLPKVMEDYFAISTQGLSAYEYIEGLLYNQTYVTESTTINSIPIYSLEPNTRIKVKGEDYIVDKLSIPLTYDGQMNITAIKAPPQVQAPEI